MASEFEPVFLPEEARLNGRASQTFLRHFNACPRSAYLYQLLKGSSYSLPLVRGSALHAATERVTDMMVEMGEPRVPPEVAKAVLEEVLVDYAVPIEEHDYLRESVYRWAAEWEIQPEHVLSVEGLFVMDIGGYEVRMKIDYAEMRQEGRAVYVVDYKSSRGAPTADDVARKRPDGTLAAKSFQLILYALGIAFGVPVRVTEEDGKRVETREALPVGVRAVDFDLEYVFPGIKSTTMDGEEVMLRRPMSLTRLELEEYRGSLAILLARVARAEETGDWPAVVSDQACSECPSRAMCPIPAEVRSHAGQINTVEEAAQELVLLDRETAQHRARRAEVKTFAKNKGLDEIRFGANKAARFVAVDKTSIPKRDEMFVQMERAVRFGEPFDKGAFVKTSTHVEFRDVSLTEDELAAEAAAKEEQQHAQ